MTKGSIFIGGCILVGSALIGVSIWFANRPGPERAPSHAPRDENAGPRREATPDTPPTKTRTLVSKNRPTTSPKEQKGTLAFSLGQISSKGQGWLFIKGRLRSTFEFDRLLQPVHKTFLLTPGEQEVRWLLLLPDHDYLFAVSAKVIITRNETHHLSNGLTGDFANRMGLAPGEPPRKLDSGALVLWQCRAPVMKQRTAFWAVASTDADMDALFRRTSAEVTREWHKLQNSKRWRPLVTAAERFRTAPPTKRRVWLHLPDELGGSREVDAGQLRWLRNWLLIEFESATHQVPKDLVYPAGDAERARRARAYQPQLDALNRQINGWRQALERALDDMIAALEKAPEAT
jgi:hypothetical protein